MKYTHPFEADRARAVVVPLSVAAKILDVPPRWLREEVEAGRIRAIKTGEKSWLVNVGQVERALAARLGVEPEIAQRPLPPTVESREGGAA